METQGLTGSLSTAAVRGAIEPRLDDFAICFARHGRRLRTLGGRIELKFTIATDGRVDDVHAIDSTVGHRAVERCVVDVAADVRFPRPQGGVAEARWPLELDPPEHLRHPVTWDPGRVRGVVRRRGARLLRECRVDGSFQVTTYVSRRGRVIAAGAVAPEPVADEHLDCVARAVRQWRMPRSQRLAKVTFDLR
jgi:TonB family protein